MKDNFEYSKEAIINLYNHSEMTSSQIAKALGVARWVVQGVGRKNGISDKRIYINKKSKIMNNERKISDCKSRRCTPRILELYNTTNLTSSEIGRVIGLTSPMVKKVAKANGISEDRYTKRPKSIWLKEDRNAEIIEALKEGDVYEVIAERFGITKQRVSQLAKKHDLTRWKVNRIKYEKLVDDINKDYKAGMSYDDIVDKYDLNNPKIKWRVKYYGLDALAKRFREIRNLEITRKYRVKSAIQVVRDGDIILDDPTRIESVRSIYEISSANGFRKFPNVERGMKGIFVDDKVKAIIRRRKNSPKRYTNKMIADELNQKGFRSAHNQEFKDYTVHNIWMKMQSGVRRSKVKMK